MKYIFSYNLTQVQILLLLLLSYVRYDHTCVDMILIPVQEYQYLVNHHIGFP